MSKALSVEAYRQATDPNRKSKLRIEKEEWFALAALAPAVVISPFLLGGMVWWSQVTIACLQVLAFVLVATPITGLASWRGRMVRLLRFPPFWLGGLFVLYVTIQALNPSWEQIYISETQSYVTERKPEYFIQWLPTSMNTNFYTMNAWRMVVFWSGAWLFVAAMWMGLKNRSAWLALGWIALVTGAILSLASIAHHLSSDPNLFWLSKYKRSIGAFGPFVYRNQGAVYLYLTMGLGLAMFLHFLRRGHMRSGLPWVALALSFACLLGVALNPSRGGWLGAGGILALFLVLLPFSIRWTQGISLPVLISSAVIVLALLGVGFWVARTMDFSEIEKKWATFSEGDDVSFNARFILSRLTWEMFEEKPWTGWGAGSFQYQFPYYGLSYPELYFAGKPGWKSYGKVTNNYKQSHNDLFQFLAEYGIFGCSLLVLCGAYCLFFPAMTGSVLINLLMVVGVSFVFLVHNMGDFFLQNSISLSAWLLLLMIGSCMSSKSVSRNPLQLR
ncbi:O-antigen ligase family protein [Cerasicoccus arenae]|uniref:O-antigen ligase-related domain-containing protein n=1 Tax=Cerasicoccus arenae TaxID=424488 RepID=A0A8J3DKR8_9BACT|nr:O-antigen ligase family protein [Cerasicoccus arenae]MBK1858637.1 O-antigen ligase family protein [Cerasicoccus arenae]GHC04848.1 hypothetical protein GCM10007047_22140 [Cerasicoccus arenae]